VIEMLFPGRAVRHLPAPPQTRTSGFPAYGSSDLRFCLKFSRRNGAYLPLCFRSGCYMARYSLGPSVFAYGSPFRIPKPIPFIFLRLDKRIIRKEFPCNEFPLVRNNSYLGKI